MLSSRDYRYDAFRRRDVRFDGRFFVGVRTTGIYCRPICPAPSPKPENVRFFSCAAAAEEAGFRPCLRCRPDAAPGSPAWDGTSAVVSRALRLIAEGALIDGQVDGLADRLGLTSRHLRRLFDRHLGASPLSVARTCQVHFARQLIDEPELSFCRVAELSGFGSIRQFNRAIRETFRMSPSELRERTAQANPAAAPGVLLRLPYRPPLDWTTLLAFLAPRAIPGVEEVDNLRYRRTISALGAAGWVEVSPLPGEDALGLVVEVESPRSLFQIAACARRLFDLAADPQPIIERLGRDRQVGRAIRRGLRVPGAWDPFELAVRTILGQQVSVAGATTLAGRLVSRFGTRLSVPAISAGLTHVFPGPEALAGAPLEAIGLPRRRALAIRALAGAVVADPGFLHGADGTRQAVERLLALPGIGPWTAEYIAMRALGDPDAFPAGDLGLRQAVGGTGRTTSPVEVLQAAEAWRPWRAYAALAIWASHARRTGSR
jgi:AraC family transcriptional regulator of adaptative response / DNA-3-methyladenine glycosylase II